MRSDEIPPEEREIPKNWDVLAESPLDDDIPAGGAPPTDSSGVPPTINLLASSWADAVASLVVCTAALFGLNAAGHTPSLTVPALGAGARSRLVARCRRGPDLDPPGDPRNVARRRRVQRSRPPGAVGGGDRGGGGVRPVAWSAEPPRPPALAAGPRCRLRSSSPFRRLEWPRDRLLASFLHHRPSLGSRRSAREHRHALERGHSIVQRSPAAAVDPGRDRRLPRESSQLAPGRDPRGG